MVCVLYNPLPILLFTFSTCKLLLTNIFLTNTKTGDMREGRSLSEVISYNPTHILFAV